MRVKELFRTVVVLLLKLEAQAILKKYRPKIILVTGSVGKTSTKDAIYAVLAPHFFVRKSEKSFNSDVGAPLTVLGVPNGWANPIAWVRNLVDGLLLLLLTAPYPEWLVVEVGADRPGDITESLKWLRPDIVVATRFPAVSVHVEFYDSPEEVQKEELAPLYWLRPGGTAILNGDDEFVTKAPRPEGVDVVTYGAHEGDVRAQKVKYLTHAKMPRGTSFDVVVGKEKAHVSLDGGVGVAQVYAPLAAVAVGKAVGLTLEAAAAGLETHVGPPGRMRLIAGVKDTMLLDDTYNASPVATEDALQTLSELPRIGKRVAVLGDMLELGPYSVSEHERIGAMVPEYADILITVGMRARKIADRAREKMADGAVLQFDRALDAAEHLKTIIEKGDVILLKGSQGIRMERAVKELMDSPEFAKDLLCRQDAEWLTR